MNCNVCGREFWLGTDGQKYEIDNHTAPHVCVLTEEQKAKEWEARKKNDAAYANNSLSEKDKLMKEMSDNRVKAEEANTKAVLELAAAIMHLSVTFRDKK